MAEKSGFFNGKLLMDSYGYPKLHEDGSHMYDREYTAAEFADMFTLYLTSGIRNGGVNLKVVAAGGLKIKVMPGDAMIKGYYYRLLDAPKEFVLKKFTASGNRIDRIVLRLDLRPENGRKITVEILEGWNGAVGLTRNNEIWELCLGEITVPMNWDAATDAEIKDTRLDVNLCGLINSRVEVDTTLLLNQMDEYFRQKQAQWNTATSAYDSWYNDTSRNWSAWFNEIKVDIFSQTNTIFDDWSRHVGYKKEVEFLKNDHGVCYRISEKLYNSVNNKVHATRTTEFFENHISETLWYSEPVLNVTKITTFQENKIVEEIK